HKQNVIIDAANNIDVGTRFITQNCRLETRKNWIFAGSRSTGEIVVDKGAEQAILSAGSSLLAKGIVDVDALFLRGQIVTIVTKEKKEIARGIVRYKASDIEKIKGIHSNEIESVLGYEHGRVVVHRDDLVLLH
ncbi:MAG TPA: glutamate 5-kinase, partial [Psychromonas hadalis]|nr:glutamate 5-kinase [Psychromonas hadalis]